MASKHLQEKSLVLDVGAFDCVWVMRPPGVGVLGALESLASPRPSWGHTRD